MKAKVFCGGAIIITWFCRYLSLFNCILSTKRSIYFNIWNLKAFAKSLKNYFHHKFLSFSLFFSIQANKDELLLIISYCNKYVTTVLWRKIQLKLKIIWIFPSEDFCLRKHYVVWFQAFSAFTAVYWFAIFRYQKVLNQFIWVFLLNRYFNLQKWLLTSTILVVLFFENFLINIYFFRFFMELQRNHFN